MLDFQGTGERLDAASFVRRHWHRQPLWMPRATDLDHLPLLEPDEVAWLATEDDVESRLVITDRSGEATRYRLRTGPFAAEELQALPDRDWTLLVQDVEKHLPELRAWFELIDFIPDWRIDDLMISVAAPGGSVGPHVDNYDVFLVQALGCRHWQWTAKHPPDDQGASTDLRLVQAFEGEGSHDARSGDVLYLPPGVAHHGIAEDLCVTCSVGMRAPQLSDLAALPPDTMDAFYNDADLEIDEARPGFISHSAVLRAERLLTEHGLPAENGGRALGCFATRPKEWLRPDLPESRMPLEQRLEIHGMARLAWSNDLVFANGEAHELPASAEKLLAALCAARRLEPEEQRNWLHRNATRRLLEWLWTCGIFESPWRPGRTFDSP